MNAGIIEIIGLFLVMVGAGTIVAAASLVSTALAVLTAGAFAVLAGLIAVYVALQLERTPRVAPAPRPGGETR